MQRIRAFCAAVMLFSGLCSALGQLNSAPTPYLVSAGGPDIINLYDLSTSLIIPILNKPGRGTDFNYQLTYSAALWRPVSNGTGLSWMPVANNGWQGLSPAGQSQVTYTSSHSQQNCYTGGTMPTPYDQWTIGGFSYLDNKGVGHSFYDSLIYYQSPGGSSCPPNGLMPANGITETATDGSGLTLYVTAVQGTASGYIVDKSGTRITPPFYSSGSSSAQNSFSSVDRNGNEITNNGNGQYLDTLGTNVLNIVGTAPSTTVLTYTAPSGSKNVTVSYVTQNLHGVFGCSTVTDYPSTPTPLVDRVTLADGTFYHFTYESTPTFPGDVTGRIASIALPTGGVINYAYLPDSKGNIISCTDGKPAVLSRTTPDTGSNSWVYTRTMGTSGISKTLVADPERSALAPSGNEEILHFQGMYPVDRQTYRGLASAGNLLRVVSTCYNGAAPPCGANPITAPILSAVTTTVLGTSPSVSAVHQETYTSAGLTLTSQDTDFARSGTGTVLQMTNFTYPPNDTAGIPSISVTDYSGKVVYAPSLQFDGAAVLSSSGSFQLAAPPGSRGNLTQITYAPGLSELFTYYDTGEVATHTDINGAVTAFGYSANTSCSNAFPISITEPLGLAKSFAWNCAGAVQTSATNENGRTSTTVYTDTNFWRPTSRTSYDGSVTSFGYLQQSRASSYLAYNSNRSVTEQRVLFDGLGRSSVVQAQQSPSSSTFDSVQVSYDVRGRVLTTTLPYSGSVAQLAPANTPGSTTTYDALDRPVQVVDAAGGIVTYAYNLNDVLVTVGPAPAGENAKRRQLEYDALGRLTSVCELTNGTASWPAGTCGQSTPQTGYWTRYTYDPVGRLTNVIQNAQAASGQQTRAMSYDLLGRKTQEILPETGTTTYTYDFASQSCPGPFLGDLVSTTDTMGNVTCYSYDAFHRPLSSQVVSGPYAANTSASYWVYDAATLPGGAGAAQNAKGTLAEAYTCTGNCAQKLTDIFFSSTTGSGMTTSSMFESTPHSGGFYKTQQAQFPNGALSTSGITFNGAATGYPNLTYTPDGEGRPNAISDATRALTTAATYTPASSINQVTFGNTDADTYGYDSQSDRITSFQFAVGGSSPFSLTGGLTWNPGTSLKQLAITDTNDSSKNQTCTYGGDDLDRTASVNCGSSWAQTFAYDPFGNIQKVGNQSYAAVYNPAKNQVTSGVTANYDALGNQTQNTFTNLIWNAQSQPVTIGGVTATYDALGRMVETTAGSNSTQYLYDAAGTRLGTAAAGHILAGMVALPGGATAVYNSSGFAYFRHADWLGSSRLATQWTHAIYSKTAYAPFGETYDSSGSTDSSFTGQEKDATAPMVSDFLFRKYDASAGRWLSPDPAGWAAVGLTSPQSLNRYSYVGDDALRFTDPAGLDESGTYTLQLDAYYFSHDDNIFLDLLYLGGGWGGGGGGYLPQLPNGGDFTGGGRSLPAPNSGQHVSAACKTMLVNMLNSELGLSFTTNNIVNDYLNGTAGNIVLESNNLTAAQFNSIRQGRYTTYAGQGLFGFGMAGHLTAEPQYAAYGSSVSTGMFLSGDGNVTYGAHLTFHDDHGYANNPLGNLCTSSASLA